MSSERLRRVLPALLLALAACGGNEPQGDRLLLPRFEPGAAETPAVRVVHGGRKLRLAADRPRRVTVAHSERLALLTFGEASWSAPIDAGRDAVVELTVTALGEAGATSRASVELRRGERGESLAVYELAVDERWHRHRIALPAGARGRLALRSEGPAAVAWAELHLTGPAPPPERPDVVLIVIDTLRADHLSVYGYERPTSPELERLAAESLVFERSYSASTWTLPSTASLLTGLLPAQHGLRTTRDRLPGAATTVAERLHRAGYRTVAFTDGGFVGPTWGLAQGFERYDATAGKPWQPKDVATIAGAAERWLEDNAFHPFFLLVHTYETHQPYQNTEGFADPFLDPADRGKPLRRGTPRGRLDKPLGARRLRRLVALYDGEIRRADHYLGQLIDRLRAGERYPRTAVLVTSDHGEEFLEHGGLEHGLGKVFDPNVRVPLIVKPPAGTAEPGRATAAPVTGLDVAPTILELAGLEPPRALEGRSLLRVAGGAARAVVVEGLNSFPELDENRFRLDLGAVTVILDRVRGVARWYDRDADPALKKPREDFSDPRARRAADRLQALLAWAGGEGLVARLPDASAGVAADPGSRIEPLGAWSGLAWREPAGGSAAARPIELAPGGAHFLRFALRPGGRGWTVRLAAPGGGAFEPLRLLTRRDGDAPWRWRPLEALLPPDRVVFPAAERLRPGRTRLDRRQLEELRALGYLE